MSDQELKSAVSSGPVGSGSPLDPIAQLSLVALREASLDAVLEAAVRAASGGLRTERAAFFEFLPGSEAVTMRSGVGWSASAAGRKLLLASDVVPLRTERDDAAPFVLQDVHYGFPDAELSLLREQGVVSGLAVRVERGTAPFGLLGVYSSARRDFTSDDARLLSAIGAVASAAATRFGRDQALRESEARLAGIIASAMDAIIAVDDAQRIVLFNHAAETVFRCPAAEAVGAPLDRFIPARAREAHREHIRRFGERGTTVRHMGRLEPLSGLRADGEEFPIEASISHAEVGGKRVFTVILRDITERHRLEAQLLHSQKLESVGRLAGGIAHDFSNVLTAIFGYLDLARTHGPPDGPVRECVDAIQVAAQRAADLTAKLLAFARKQVIEPTIVDLNQLIRGVLGMATRILGDDIETVVHETPLLPNVRVDPGQFEQALMNLATNARDAMPSGGKFIVETSRVELDEAYAELRPDLVPGTYVQLAVSDTGVGMDPVTLEHCFEPFFTTKAAKHGTGLGLASCHGIVKQSGGHISVYSEPGHGTTFRIFLPACGELAAAAPPKNGPPVAIHSGTILLVEDDPLVRSVAARTLRDCGYTVLEAADADEALSRVEQTNTSIDLLLTDVVLPKLGGGELARRLREARPELRVLYTSGFTDNMVAQQGVLASGGAFLSKPYTPSALAAKIRELLTR